MNLKITVLFILCAFFRIGAYSQTYYRGDIDALNALSESTGQEYFLNWYQAPPQYWEGVTWWLDVEGQMYRVSGLNLANKNISGNLVVKDLYYLTSLQCQNNSLRGLTIENCPSLTGLNCAANQLPISELLKYTYLGIDYAYGPQHAVFEEKTEKPGYVIDYSSQADGGNTTFCFRNRSKPGTDGSEIIAVNNTGICPTTEEGVYFCEMTNPKLSQNVYYSHTANTIISEVSISMTTALPVGSVISLTLNRGIDGFIQIDFGDGIKITKQIGSTQLKTEGIVGSSQQIKIYGDHILLFSCYDQKLTSLDVRNCKTLQGLFFGRNQVKFIDITQCKSLSHLGCQDNLLTNLDLTQNTLLKQLTANNNKFKTLDLSNNPDLNYLSCIGNEISTLDIAANKKLEQLICDENKLTHLDLSKQSELIMLNCENNNLTSLDLSYSLKLKELWCWQNQLNTLDISHNPNLEKLYCYNNSLPISELLKCLRNTINFQYYSQYAVFDEATYSTNVTLDYSAQADGGNTTFVFRNRSNPGNDGTEIVAVNNTGIYTTQGNGVYFCEMANPKLNQNNFYSHTANTTINLSGNSSLKSMSAAEASTTSINDESSELIRIYPNPVVDVINAELPNNNLPATITLYSIDGKQLKKTETTSAKTTINMEDLKRGSYIIAIETAKEKIKRKVVKL